VDEVEVIARRTVTGSLQQGVQAYRPEYFIPVRPGTAMDMIRWLPSFTFEDTRDQRGLAGAIGNVLVDGQPPTSKSDTLAMVLGRIPASQVDRIDIIVGSAPGIDMRGRAAIANVVLKKTVAPQGAATLTGNRLQDGRTGVEFLANIARKTEATTSEASVTLISTAERGPIFGRGLQVRRDMHDGTIFEADAQSKIRVQVAAPTGAFEFPFANGRLRANGSYRYIDGQLEETATVRGTGTRSSRTSHDKQGLGELGLRYTRNLSTRSTLETQLLQRSSSSDTFTDNKRPGQSSQFTQSQTRSESVLRSSLRFKQSGRLTVEFAGEGAFNTFDTTALETAAGLARPLPAADVEVTEGRGEIGATVTWKPNGTYGVTAGLKAETSTLRATGDVNLQRDFTYAKPRIILTWSPRKNTQLRLRSEYEVSQISFSNFAAAVEYNGVVRAGNPGLRPRRAQVTEAVLEQQFWTGASLVTTLRHQAIRDLVDTRLAPGFGTSLEIGNIGRARWTDLSGTVTLPLKRFGFDGVMVKGSLTRTWTQAVDPTTAQRRRISDAADLNGDAHIVYDLPRWKLNLGVDYLYGGASLAYDPTVVEKTTAYKRLGIFVEYRLQPNLTARLEVQNLNDPTPRNTLVYFAGPRPAPILYVDERVLGDGPTLLIRLRRTLH